MTTNTAFVRAVAGRGTLTEDELHDVLGHTDDAARLLRYVIRQERIPKEEAVRLWADGFGVAYVDLEQTLFQPEVVQRLPRSVAERHRMVPIYEVGSAVTLAMANPADQKAVAAARDAMGSAVSPVCALPELVDRAIEVEYHSFGELAALKKEAALAVSLSASDRPLAVEDLERLSGQNVVVKLVETLLLLALKERASDIHLEPHEGAVVVRFRVDGQLLERTRLSLDVYPRVLSRVKILSGMNIAERRRPQDGRISLSIGSGSLDFRVSVVPSIHGEKVALRVLGQLQLREVSTLDELGLSSVIRSRVRDVIASPNGVFFVTGPTGSGKTTTMFSVLREINRPGVNIMTVEEPVEYRLPGVTQVPVDRSVGMGFAEVLRAFLRQDPDVMLIGEIRDLETARIATEAALTGHLVLATLHTNDAIQATTRLIEIGVEPFLVGPSIIGVMAQRLVRAICRECRVAYDPGDAVLDRLFEREPGMRPQFYNGAGCVACGHTGYRGRLAIHELVVVDAELRRLITAKAPINEVYAAAAVAGWMPLRYDGVKKVLRGLTTIDEVDRLARAS